jgi:HTH-type transcriptional regulator / antitoxin HigA
MIRTLKPIHTKTDYEAAQARAAELVLASPAKGSAAGDELDILATLIATYDHEHFPLGPADPIAAISFAMDQRGMDPKDLVPYLGTRSRVSEVLSGKRGLSIEQMSRLYHGLGIPLECLMPAVSPRQIPRRTTVKPRRVAERRQPYRA